jgi:lipopolysaccharide export LptBFGC system permease protein LptF
MLGRPVSTLDRYVLTRVSRLFLPALLGLGLLFFTGASFRLLRDEDLSLRQIALALPSLVPYLLPYLLPVAYALGGALALSQAREQREVLALAALGVSRRRVLAPALWLSLPLVGLSLLIGAEVAPAAYRARRQVAKAVLLQLQAGGEHLSRSLRGPGTRVYARRVDGSTLRGLVLDVQPPGVEESVQVVAERGELQDEAPGGGMALALEGVSVTYRPAAGGGFEAGRRLPSAGPLRVHVAQWRQSLTPGAGSGSVRRRIEGRSSAELRRLTAAGPQPAGDRHDTWFKARLELRYRLALGLAPLLVGVVGFPLALRARNPLLGCVVGAVGGCVVAMGPLLLARGLAESQRQTGWLALGVGVPLLLGVVLFAWLERRA